jgi:type II secretory pathway component HofQ
MKRTVLVLFVATLLVTLGACQGRRRIVVATPQDGAPQAQAPDAPADAMPAAEAPAAETAPAEMAEAGEKEDGDEAAGKDEAGEKEGAGDDTSSEALMAESASSAKLLKDRAEYYAKVLTEKAQAAEKAGNVDEARRLYAKAIDNDPSNQAAREGWNRLSEDRASTVGDYAEKERGVAQVRREKAAAEVRNYIERGRTLEAREQWASAVKEYQKALSIISWYDETADFGASADSIRDMISNAKYRAEVGARRTREKQIASAQKERERELAGERDRQLGRIRAWFQGAHRAFAEHDYGLAREYAKQILRQDSQNSDAQRIIEMSYDAEHTNNEENNRRRFDDQWKSIMEDMEHAITPQVDTVVFPDNWLDDIADRKPRIVGQETPQEDTESIAGILEIVNKKRVKGLDWSEQNLDQVVAYLRTITGLNFYVSPKVREEKFEDVVITVQLDDVSVRTILDHVVTEPFGLKWEVRGGVIWIVTAEETTGKMRLRYFDVKDLAVQIRHFVGQPINLVPSNFTPPEPPELPEPQPIFPAENLVELIRETVGGEDKWEDPATIEARNNILIVRNTPEILSGVENLLRQLRANTGLLVNLEIRFLTAEDNFLRDAGVDIRGLGDNSAGIGAPGLGSGTVQDDVFAGTTANPSGVPFGTNSEPSSVGTSRDTGIFYNDGQDGAYSARVENLFDATVKRFGDPSVLTPSGGLSFQHTFLDDTQLEVILRAVDKSERIQQITAPRITVYNTQRATVSVLNQISYVQDYDVEIAQASNIANPIIARIQDGIVMDVRPVVSADRRFVTLELRPTVAVLQRPIPTFTTSLASGPITANAPVTLQVPELRVSRVRTTVNMPDNGTLLLGGLKFYAKDNRESGMPFFNNIPILSFLLSRKGTYVNRRNLLVLITARIVPLEELEPHGKLNVPDVPTGEWTPIHPVDDGTPGCGVPMSGSTAPAKGGISLKPPFKVPGLGG